MALIDPSIVRKLLVTQLKLVSSTAAGTLLLAHEEDDDALSQWFRLTVIDTIQRPRRTASGGDAGSELDQADLTVVVTVHARDQATQASGDVLNDAAAAAVNARMVDALLRDTSTKHEVWVRSVSIRDLGSIDEQRSIRARQLTYSGVVTRSTGATTGGPVHTPPAPPAGD